MSVSLSHMAFCDVASNTCQALEGGGAGDGGVGGGGARRAAARRARLEVQRRRRRGRERRVRMARRRGRKFIENKLSAAVESHAPFTLLPCASV